MGPRVFTKRGLCAGALALSTCGVLFASSGGADLASYRTERVRSGFDASKTAGQWYEVLVADPAQVGASCQRYVNNVSEARVEQAFECRYGSLPFSQTYIYESLGRGLYTKYLSGAKSILRVPTVVVDALEETNGQYGWLLEYSEISILGVPVRELRVSARAPDASKQAAADLLETFVSVGIDRGFVKRASEVDHQSCRALEAARAGREPEPLPPSLLTSVLRT